MTSVQCTYFFLHRIKVHCEQTRELTDELSYFLDCLMLYGLGNFVVDYEQ